jgi:hypothetical protein
MVRICTVRICTVRIGGADRPRADLHRGRIREWPSDGLESARCIGAGLAGVEELRPRAGTDI